MGAVSIARGGWALALQNLRNTVADCDEFRTWTASDTNEKALNRCHLYGHDSPEGEVHTIIELQQKRPYAQVLPTRDGGVPFATQLEAVGGGTRFQLESGIAWIRLWDDVPSELHRNFAEVAMLWYNRIGVLMAEMWALNGTGGYLAFSGLACTTPPIRVAEEDANTQGDWVFAELTIRWGQGVP